MKSISKLLIVLCLLLPQLVLAQTLSNKDKRHINMRLLNLIEQYEENATLHNDGARYAFRKLFKDPYQTLVYSDMLDYSAGQLITADKYIEQMSNKENVSIKIMDVSKSDFLYQDGLWYITLSFNKSVIYTDRNGVLFSSPEYYNADHTIYTQCCYDRNADRCYITKIEGSIESATQHLPERFIVLTSTTKNLDKITKKDKPFQFNSFDQTFIDPKLITSSHEDTIIAPDSLATGDNYALVDIAYRTTHWRAKVHAGISVGSALNVTSATELNINNSSALEFGFELGYAIPMGKASTFGIYTGAGLSTTKLELGLDDISYSFKTMDSKGIEYTRYYELSKITEGVSYVDVFVPLSLGLEINLFKSLYLGGYAGGKVYFNGKTKCTPYHMIGRVYGKYGSETVTSNAAEAFTEIDSDVNQFLAVNSSKRNPIDYSIIGGASLNYGFCKNTIIAFVKCSYEMGLDSIYENNGLPIFDARTNRFPMVYSASLKENIATRSLFSGISYKRQILWVELGVTFKF